MSKRFVDYYLEAVTKKSGGGGGYPEPTGTINITSNGTHNVKDKATANVNVPQPSLGPLSGFIHSNGAVDFFPSDYGYDAFDSVSITADVPSGGGSAEIIIPDNSLGTYIEGTGDPMDAQTVINWYDMFDPTAMVNCTFASATPNLDDRVLLTGDVVSSNDFVTVVGRYAIWGVCGSFYDGIAIQFSEALGFSFVDEEQQPSNMTTITENADMYQSESGSQIITVDVQGSGGGDDYEVFEGYFTAQSGSNNVQLDHAPSGDLVGYMFSAVDGASVNASYKVASCSAFDNGDASYPIKIAGVGRASSGSNWTGQMGAMQAFPSVPSSTSQSSVLNAVGYDGNGGFNYLASTGNGTSTTFRLLAGIVYNYVAVFKKSA